MKRRRDGSRAGSNGAFGLDLLLDSIAKVRGVESSYRINNDFSFRMNSIYAVILGLWLLVESKQPELYSAPRSCRLVHELFGEIQQAIECPFTEHKFPCCHICLS